MAADEDTAEHELLDQSADSGSQTYEERAYVEVSGSTDSLVHGNRETLETQAHALALPSRVLEGSPCVPPSPVGPLPDSPLSDATAESGNEPFPEAAPRGPEGGQEGLGISFARRHSRLGEVDEDARSSQQHATQVGEAEEVVGRTPVSVGKSDQEKQRPTFLSSVILIGDSGVCENDPELESVKELPPAEALNGADTTKDTASQNSTPPSATSLSAISIVPPGTERISPSDLILSSWSPPPSPLSSVEDFGVAFSVSPSFNSALQQQGTRPESFTIDPSLPASRCGRDRSSVFELEEDEQQISASLQYEFSDEKDEDDSSMLPPLSTLPEDDPFFTLSPSRTCSTTSDSSFSLSSGSTAKSALNSIEYARNLIAAVKQRHGRQISGGSVGSSIEELGLRRYQSPAPSLVSRTTSGSSRSGRSSRAARLSHDDSTEFVEEMKSDVPSDVDPVTGWRPYNEKESGFEPGSSTGTVRPSPAAEVAARPPSPEKRASTASKDVPLPHPSEPVAPPAIDVSRLRSHAGGSSGASGNTRTWEYTITQQRFERNKGESSDSDFGDRRQPPGRGDGNDGGRGGDGDEDRQTKSSNPTTSSSSAQTTDSETTDSEDNYGEEVAIAVPISLDVPPSFSQRRNGRKGVFKRDAELQPSHSRTPGSSHNVSAEEDDVPLAQRIPRALEAQQSIRRQVRDEKDRRKRERNKSRPLTEETFPTTTSLEERGRSVMPRAPLSAMSNVPMSSSQEAALLAMQQQKSRGDIPRRARAKTIGEATLAFPADDLTRRLLRVQAQGTSDRPGSSSSTQRQQPLRTSEELPTMETFPPKSRTVPTSERVSTATSASAPQRSHYSPLSPTGVSQTQPVPTGVLDISRDTGRPLRHMRSFHGPSSNAHASSSAAVPPVPIARRPSSSRGRLADEITADVLGRSKSVRSTRSSMEESRSNKLQRNGGHDHPPMPPMPDVKTLQSLAQGPPSPVRTGFASQMRIFIGDLQRFNMVEVGPTTNAKDVLEIIRNQGDLRDDERKSGGWMVWELCQDFGMGKSTRLNSRLMLW